MTAHDFANNLVTVLGMLVAAFTVFILVAPVIRMVAKSYSKKKTVPAIVHDKYKGQRFSKYAGSGTVEEYFIVFEFNGKKKSFRVSDFSYNGYQVKDKGMLTYKGDTLIDFK